MPELIIMNSLIALFAILLSFRFKGRNFNLFTAATVFLLVGIVVALGTIPVWENFEISVTLNFVAILLIIFGIVMLIISRIIKSPIVYSVNDIASAFALSSIVLLYFMRNQSLSFNNLLVPEVSILISIILLYKAKPRS